LPEILESRMNVLISSASRKVWLVREFQAAVSATGGKVVACDAERHAAALYAADMGIVSPSLGTPDFLAFLLDTCTAWQIGLIVPTRDAELPWFAEHRKVLADAGVTVMVSTPEAIRTCQDKLAFIAFCRKHGFPVPHTYRPEEREEIEYPVFVKPRFGSAARGAQIVENREALAATSVREGELIIQSLLRLPEYTLDTFSDFSGRVISVVPRERLKVCAGESIVGRTVDAPQLVNAGKDLAESLGLIGHATIQCFWDGSEVTFIEVNPRFGGGAALGFKAGISTPRVLVSLMAGERVEPCLGEYRKELFMFRHSQDIYVSADELDKLKIWSRA